MSIESAWNLYAEEMGESSKEEETPRSSFNAMSLAKEFQDKFSSAEWSGLGQVNLRALSGAIAKWRDKVDSDTVKAMISLYVMDPTMRGSNPSWKDFLNQAEKLRVKVSAVPTKSKWDLMQEEWEKKNGSA